MAKYTFESTTVGEIMADDQARELFFELVPEAKDYEDLLELGSGFTIEAALPFVENIADSIGIENTQERIADFKEKLYALE